mmetsp:Transcript_88804/g.212011  ORF Transcript_88804/g.212011 Transcript_88804/m.212011 type:complete len:204 (-) Transcript_88804:602-1213(-)
MQGQTRLDGCRHYMAYLLPHGDATVEQGHLKSGAHLLALLLCTLVERSHEPKRDRKGSCLRHDRENEGDNRERGIVTNDVASKEANNRPNENAGSVDQAWTQASLEQEHDNRQSCQQLKSRAILSAHAEGVHAFTVAELRLRPFWCMLVTFIDGICKPLRGVVGPGGVSNPRRGYILAEGWKVPDQTLHKGEMVEKAWHASYR